MPYKYSYKDYNKENMARALGIALPISTKQAIEICSFIRNKTLAKAKEELKKAIEGKQAIPFKRFTGGVGHKTKIGPGSYPKKASKEIIKLLETVEANAQFKGLSTADLIIKHLSANKAAKAWHYGRMRRQMKRTTIEITVEEGKSKKLSNVPEGYKKSETFFRKNKKLPKEGLGKAKLSQKEARK